MSFWKRRGLHPPAIEDDCDTAIRSYDLSCFFQDRLQHPGHGGVCLSRNHEKRISSFIVHPVIRSGRHGEALLGKERLGDAPFTVVGTDMTIDVQKAKYPASLPDTPPGEFPSEFLALFHLGKAGKLPT